MGSHAAAGDEAALARTSIMMRGGEGIAVGGAEAGLRPLTDMVLALQLRVGEVDCEVLKVGRQN